MVFFCFFFTIIWWPRSFPGIKASHELEFVEFYLTPESHNDFFFLFGGGGLIKMPEVASIFINKNR